MAIPENPVTNRVRRCLSGDPWASTKRGPFTLLFRDSRTIFVDVPPEDAFTPIRRIGGDTGWYYANFLWQLRGLLDLLVGGIGLRRGRRDPDRVREGDTIDCWRIQECEPDRRLLLALEMRYPGSGCLEFEVTPTGSGSTIRQTATYHTGGFFGCLYWYSSYPLHEMLFQGMLRRIAEAAVTAAEKRKEDACRTR